MANLSAPNTQPATVVALSGFGPNAHGAAFPLLLGAARQSVVCNLDNLPPGQTFGSLTTIFVDNTSNEAAATVSFADTAISADVPAQSAVYVLAITGARQFQISSPVTVNTAISVAAMDVAIHPTGVQPISGAVNINAGTVEVGNVALNAGTADVGTIHVAGTADVQFGGSVGTDHSANAGAAGGTQLTTVAVNPTRNGIGVQNQSAAQIMLVRDDGAGNNTTLLYLTGASAAGQQGADWYSQTFKGRLRIYGAAGSQVACYED